MTEKLLTGTLSLNTNKQKLQQFFCVSEYLGNLRYFTFCSQGNLVGCRRCKIEKSLQVLSNQSYRKNPKYSDTQRMCCNHPKIWTRWLYQTVMHPKDAAGIANSVDPDQTAPLELELGSDHNIYTDQTAYWRMWEGVCSDLLSKV